MLRTLLFTLPAALLAGACQQIPQSSESPAPEAMRSSAKLMPAAAAGASAQATGSPYGAAIVKDLEIGAGRPENLTGVDLANFEAVRGELSRLFGTAFRETLHREGYVRAALPDESNAETVIIQPATMRISPGYNVGGVGGISPSELEIAVSVRDAKGRFLGWYAVQYSGALTSTAVIARTDVLRRVFADAGEQAARAIAKGR